ncbi:hypothetical protein [Streptomyces anulatus]|uniref:hypothetical protein n=1 Tax=Streptomyces anulatus TaxID=1892 RepID=UPI003409957D
MRWSRVCTRVLALTRTLKTISDDMELPPPSPDFLRLLSDVLSQAGRICSIETELLTGSGTGELREGRDAAFREAWGTVGSLTDAFHRQEPSAAAVGGELLREARQLMTELAPSA